MCFLFLGDSELNRSEKRRKKRRSRWGPQEASGSAEGSTAVAQMANVPPPAVVVNPQLGQPGIVVNPVLGGSIGQGFGIGEYSLPTHTRLVEFLLEFMDSEDVCNFIKRKHHEIFTECNFLVIFSR